MRISVGTVFLMLGVGVVAGPEQRATDDKPTKAIPYGEGKIHFVASAPETVLDMLWIARVGAADIVYDLGSGDGRIAIAAVRDFNAKRAIGIENDAELVRESREAAQAAGVDDRVKFIEGDLFNSNFEEATVVTLYIGNRPNLELRPALFKRLKPGTRIVSHQFNMGEWMPDKTMTTYKKQIGMYGTIESSFQDNQNVPHYIGNQRAMGMSGKIFLWVVPHFVAGVWRGVVPTSQGELALELRLFQTVSNVYGTVSVSGYSENVGFVQADNRGETLRWVAIPKNDDYHSFRLEFEGAAVENRMNGTLKVIENRQSTAHEGWTAQCASAQVEGDWELAHPVTNSPILLRIANKNGVHNLVLVYEGQEISISDFYVWGNGFYFTHLLGGGVRGHVKDDQIGWLIGRACVEGETLHAVLDLYSYENATFNGPRERVSAHFSVEKAVMDRRE